MVMQGESIWDMLVYMVDLAMESEILTVQEYQSYADSLGLVICNMCFMKQNSKLVSYESGPSKSTVVYLLVRNRDKMMVRNAMVFQTRYAFQITNY